MSANGKATELRRPTFLCIGAGKAGTTWLWETLRQHPDIYLPDNKEVHYFNAVAYDDVDFPNPNFDRPVSWYLRHFAPAGEHQICGEISPSYLWDTEAPERIRRFDPDMRIIVILREPVDRLFSSYLFGQQVGQIGKEVSFEEALDGIDRLMQRAPVCEDVGCYVDLFGRQRVLVLLYDELAADAAGLLRRIYGFLGVREVIPPDVGERRNVTGQSRYPTMTRFLMRSRTQMKRYGLEWFVEACKRIGLAGPYRWFQRQIQPWSRRPSVDASTAERLRAHFRDDVECLEARLGLDLSAWKSPAVMEEASTRSSRGADQVAS